MPHYGVIGAGSWGTALALHLRRSGHQVGLWVHGPQTLDEIRSTGENRLYLPGWPIPRDLKVSGRLEEILDGANRIVLAVPSPFSRNVYLQIRESRPAPDVLFLIATKGIEENSHLRMSQVLASVWEPIGTLRQAVLSGPSFAAEVARGDPTAVVIASEEEQVSSQLQKEISHESFRCYRTQDMVGAELGGALKNVIAIAAGVIAGLGMGHNTVAALLTRGLVEMTRLAVTFGARERTLAGLAGMGDLVLTCTGNLSRNRSVGVALGEGKKLEEIIGGMRTVAEGIKTTRAAVTLAGDRGIDMPIAGEVYRLLFEEERSAREAIRDLLRRPLTREESLR
ncbi:MAG: NAD(P)-dependent glycerol-3-phosphate dehydrogenase [Acidobacteria bacterium]|nr:NAD(P)-dependent glycerol-3-phosphate dehydrogenase [Acidobacteriota bacterium]